MSKIKWVLDPTHSQIIFRIRYLMLTNITGFVKTFTLEAQIEENDFNNITNICFTAEASSIDTTYETRDNYLKAADCLDVNSYSLIAFEGAQYISVDNKGFLKGLLTIKETQKIVTVNLEYEGSLVDNYGNNRVGFTVKGKISRKEFGLTWDEYTNKGITILDDEVYYEGNIQLIKSI